MISKALMRKLLDKSLIKQGASLFSVNEEVLQALHDEKAVVALESTIITHGMKFPHNYETAKEVEDVIRQQSAVPATIAIIKGQVKVGLSNVELEELSLKQRSCCKVSRRDFSYVISQKLSGGTTVSGTMLIAHKIGIPVFVTGGVGGVHREGEVTMDISADLTELGKTSVAVISSGIKSILDIPKTLEYLETQGVAVASYGPSTDFPAFYCRKSGHKSPYCLKSSQEAAEFIQATFDLDLGSGILIAVPIPEKYSLDENLVEDAIEAGLSEAKETNVKGKDVTPFLLNKISEITEGMSLQSNMALIKNNAFVGARIAVELSKLRKNRKKSGNESISDFGREVEPENESAIPNGMTKPEKFDVVVIGGTNLDLVVNVEDEGFKTSFQRLLWWKMNKILKGIMKYRETDRITMVQQFKVVKDNPDPKAVFFTCIDSRMIPTRFTETCVGDMFVVRNAGNIIPNSSYYSDEVTTNEPAALELGCVINNVRHIIVCGHSDCKAMNLLYSLRNEEFSSQTNRRISPLRAWMCAHASSSLQRFLKLEEMGMKQPLVFHAETPLRKFVAYIDPEDKFRKEDKLSQMDGRTVGGKISQSGGGVARNLADALGKLQINPYLISAVGDEKSGNFVLDHTIPHLSRRGIIKSKDAGTGTCMVLCDHTGECLVVVGDMGIHKKITKDHVKNHESVIANSSLVVLDGNLSIETIEFVLRLCHNNSVPVWYEPTDVFLASKPFLNKEIPTPTFISPNFLEFKSILETIHPELIVDENSNEINECVKRGYLLAESIDNIIITLGKKGVIVIRKGEEEDPFFCIKGTRKYLHMQRPISHRIYKPNLIEKNEIVNVSGAGDCFASGFIAAMLRGENEINCIEAGFKCSTASLRCFDAVPKKF